MSCPSKSAVEQCNKSGSSGVPGGLVNDRLMPDGRAVSDEQIIISTGDGSRPTRYRIRAAEPAGDKIGVLVTAEVENWESNRQVWTPLPINSPEWLHVPAEVNDAFGKMGLTVLGRIVSRDTLARIEVDGHLLLDAFRDFNHIQDFRQALVQTIMRAGYQEYQRVSPQACKNNRQDVALQERYQQIRAEFVRSTRLLFGFSQEEAVSIQPPATLPENGIGIRLWNLSEMILSRHPTRLRTARQLADEMIQYIQGEVKSLVFGDPTKRAHNALEKAIKKGATVSQEDLLQYPDLVARYGIDP